MDLKGKQPLLDLCQLSPQGFKSLSLSSPPCSSLPFPENFFWSPGNVITHLCYQAGDFHNLQKQIQYQYISCTNPNYTLAAGQVIVAAAPLSSSFWFYSPQTPLSFNSLQQQKHFSHTKKNTHCVTPTAQHHRGTQLAVSC